MKKIVLGLIILSSAGMSSANSLDSIGQKTVNGKNYILYKVDAKETLYSLSKKYNTSVDGIKSANDGLAAGLQKGSTILIPSGSAIKSQTKLATIQALHVVGEGETLYSISKKYHVNVDDIKIWNSLTTNDISLGQELKVSGATGNKKTVSIPVSKDDALITTDPSIGIGKPDAAHLNKAPKAAEELNPVRKEDYTIDTSLYGEEVTETKVVSKISELGVDQSKNLAQMKGVKVGTILMVVNPVNNKATFVRVINSENADGIGVTNSVLNALSLSKVADANVKVSYTK